MKPQLLIACDFDGTVTRQDTLVEILDRYGSRRWRDVQKRVLSGEISIREGLQQEMGGVRAGAGELGELLKSRIELDLTFPPFLEKMRGLGIPVVLLTGGFDFCVETVLATAGLTHLPYLANRLRRNNGSWLVEFPHPSADCADCGHCKGAPIRKWEREGFTTVFAGNGVTDRCAAQAAGLTFAKDELASWCAANGVPHSPFSDFLDVERELSLRRWI